MSPFDPDARPLPILIAGDFNMTDQTDDYRRLTAKFSDTFREVGWGMGFTFPDAAREKAFRKALGLKGPIPQDIPRAMALLDALLTTERVPVGSVAVVLDYAHALAPAGASSGSAWSSGRGRRFRLTERSRRAAPRSTSRCSPASRSRSRRCRAAR